MPFSTDKNQNPGKSADTRAGVGKSKMNHKHSLVLERRKKGRARERGREGGRKKERGRKEGRRQTLIYSSGESRKMQ
jgi:hypothetical protein